MSIVDQIKRDVLNKCEEYRNNADDCYDFWDEHIKYVVDEALGLANEYSADVEIVELAALLHDIALVTNTGTRAEHHITGAKMSEEMLSKYRYPQEKINKIKDCVLHHRSSKNGNSIEEICVADADILAHFDNIPMIFNNIVRNSVTLPEIRKKLLDSFNADFNDLSERTQQKFMDRYRLVIAILLGINDITY